MRRRLRRSEAGGGSSGHAVLAEQAGDGIGGTSVRFSFGRPSTSRSSATAFAR